MTPFIAEEFLSEYGALIEKAQLALTMVSLILALMQCYFGYRFLKFWISVVGFILGFAAGLAAAIHFLPDRPWYIWAIAAAAGILLAVLSYKVYLAGVFVFTGLLAAGAVGALMELPKIAGFFGAHFSADVIRIVTVVLAVIAFVAVGILGVKFSKPFIIVITSLTGAFFATRTLTGMVDLISKNELYQALALVLFAASGVLLQHLMNLKT